ncbi:MAG TPA: glycosyltransferase family 39 protein, partial [Anaerolineae bacterium]|nr:glycosyltransferase family 39 protein [Anaerolineae bacterium]
MSLKFSHSPITRHFIILLLVLAAFFLRTYHLDGQALRGDEAATVLYSALPVADLWELSRVTDPHPPLYYLMLHPWQWLVGESAWAMRFAGVIASTLAVSVLYALARRTLGSASASLLAAGLLAVNPLQIWLAQDIRSYPFFTLLGLLSSWALWQALHSSQKPVASRQKLESHAPVRSLPVGRTTHQCEASPWDAPRLTLYAPRSTPWFLYVLLTLASFYIHYYTAFLITFQGLFVLLNFRRFWVQKWPWLASQVAIGLLIIPGLQLAYNFVGGEAGGGIDTLPIGDIFRLTSTSLLTGFTLDHTWGWWVSLLLAPIWIIGLIALLRRDFTSGTFWTLFFAIPVLGVIALSIDRPFFKERFLVQAQPAFALLLAVGFLTLLQTSEWQIITEPKRTTHQSEASLWDALRTTLPASRLLASLLLITLLFINTYAFINYLSDPVYAKAPPWQLYHDYVSDHARPGDVMLTNFPEAAVSYYSPAGLPFYVVPAERDRSVKFRLDQTEQIAAAYQRIWFLPLLRQGFDEQGDVLNWLDRHADRVHQVFFPDYNLNLYLSPPTVETKLISQPAVFAHGVDLRGYQIFDKEGDS